MQAFEGILRDSQSQPWEPLAEYAQPASGSDVWNSPPTLSTHPVTGSAGSRDAQQGSRFGFSFSSEGDPDGFPGTAGSSRQDYAATAARSGQQQGWVNGGSSSGKPKPRSMYAIGHRGDRLTHSPRILLSGTCTYDLSL